MRCDSIIARIDLALERMAFRQMEVRAICLSSEDHDQLDAELNAQQDYVSSHLSYRGHQIRSANKSVIYSTHGVGVSVPRRLSPRVRAAA